MKYLNRNYQSEVEQVNNISQWAVICWERLKKRFITRWMMKSRREISFVIGMILFIFAIGGVGMYVQTNTISFYRVYHHNKFIGTISSLEEIERFCTKRLQQEQAKYPNVHVKLNRGGIRTVKASKFKARPATSETVAKLDKLTTVYAEGVKLEVNGQTIGYVNNKATAEKIWKQVKAKYALPSRGKGNPKGVQALSSPRRLTDIKKAASRVELVEFREKVSVENTNVSPEKIITSSKVVHKLTTGYTHKVKYIVKPRDTVSSIVKVMNVLPETIYRNNRSVGEKRLKGGQVLDLNDPKPIITVKTVETYVEHLVIKPQRIKKKDPTMRSGKSKVVQKGKQGLKLMSYRLIKDNGKLSDEQCINQKIVERAIPEIIIYGTKVIRGKGTGSFRFPINGNVRVTSGFGKRRGRRHNGMDLKSSNRSIVAADEGIVEFAGENKGYGKCIIINHGNKFKTRYAHLENIKAKVGDIVEKKQTIGIMGNTGNSTGTHLHFEITKNGTVQNPHKYLGKAAK